MNPEFDITFIDNPVVVAIVGIALISAVYLLTLYRSRIARVNAYARMCSSQAPVGQGVHLPGLAVIVYVRDNSDALARMLPQILRQQYNAPFEVIVATDGRSSNADDLVKLLSAEHRNLRLTYVPDEAHALSRHKLALTLGIKSARHDFVVITDAYATPDSDRWLERIGNRIAAGADIVIGHSTPTPSSDTSLGTIAAFDILATDITRLSAAIAGKPYCADEANLAFRRSLFFDSKGFADSVAIHYGVDDIFVSRIAKLGKTVVELSPEAYVSLRMWNPRESHRAEKLSHLFTGRYVSRGPRRAMGLASAMMWIWLAATIAAGILAWPNVVPLSACLLLGIAWIAVASIAWKRAASALHIRIKPLTIPFAMMARGISTLAYRMRARMVRSKNYTWAKPF